MARKDKRKLRKLQDRIKHLESWHRLISEALTSHNRRLLTLEGSPPEPDEEAFDSEAYWAEMDEELGGPL